MLFTMILMLLFNRDYLQRGMVILMLLFNTEFLQRGMVILMLLFNTELSPERHGDLNVAV